MRILQVSTSDYAGGAERVALNLLHAYRERGHESRLAVGRKLSSDRDVHELRYQPPPLSYGSACSLLEKGVRRLKGHVRGVSRIGNFLNQVQRGWRTPFDRTLGHEDFNYPASHSLLSITGSRPDILQAHNLHGGYFDLRALPTLASQVPLVLTLHDAWLLSGHCAHSFGCDRWQSGCGKCPDLTIYPAIRRDATEHNWRRKRDILARTRVYLVTPSRWLMERAERSILAPAIRDARVIPNGVDLSVFRPATDRAMLRRSLGINSDCLVLVFAANGVRKNIWKDYATLRTAIALVAAEWSGNRILCIGLGDDSPPEQIGPARLEFVPFLRSATDVARYFQSADIYVHSTRIDTFPNSVLEAMACGLPVVASQVGGIPEQIEARDCTGLLVPAQDPRNLADALKYLLQDESLRKTMGVAAEDVARRRYDLRRQADTYISWYETILDL